MRGINYTSFVSLLCCCSADKLCPTLKPWTAAHQASLSSITSRNLLKFVAIESVMPSSHFILCRPLLLLPSIFPIRVFSNEPALHIRWPKYWSFSFNITSSSEHPGLIFFRMDWLDLLAVQGTLKSLLQHHSSKASILRHTASFIVQLSHPYMTTGKTIALTRWLALVRIKRCNIFKRKQSSHSVHTQQVSYYWQLLLLLLLVETLHWYEKLLTKECLRTAAFNQVDLGLVKHANS